MPTYSQGQMSLVLPTRNIESFLDYFRDGSYSEETGTVERVYETHLDWDYPESEIIEIGKGWSSLSFYFEAAWSAVGNLVDDIQPEGYTMLKPICERLSVFKLIARATNEEDMIEESIIYSPQNGIQTQVRAFFCAPDVSEIGIDDLPDLPPEAIRAEEDEEKVIENDINFEDLVSAFGAEEGE